MEYSLLQESGLIIALLCVGCAHVDGAEYIVMPAYHCLVVGCCATTKNRKTREKEDVEFYPVPKIVKERHIWWRLLRRGGPKDRLTFDKLNRYHSVPLCSKHFVDGNPTNDNPQLLSVTYCQLLLTTDVWLP